jgi:GTP-binding protein
VTCQPHVKALVQVLVVVNKIDRPAARPDYVIDTTFDLFCDLGADDEQCDFPVVYASGLAGKAGKTPELAENMEDLFEAIVNEIPPPSVYPDAPLQLLVTNIDYDEHKGRICIARINAGTLSKGQGVVVCRSDNEACRAARVSEVFVYKDFARQPVENAQAGDIVAIAGLGDTSIGDTVCQAGHANPLPTIEVEEPTVSMSFLLNTSPFAGQEGKFVTTRNIKERLDRELERNLALKV